ncbi:MAG TPA: UvrD-helicase domain-containing protein [Candidatus Binataceae bacterium]|nr:UvrD-helicase domain-containing protein [Candidatus Binataceae bacterium]
MTGRKLQLGVQQAAAINAAGNLLIRAGAGSGKTEVLARRMVALLAGDSDGGSPQAGGLAGRPPLAPEAIAAITFTEKAALDMCARIAGVLEERIAEAAESAPARCEVLVQARRRLALARISTIHAFCARILRENPVAAGLDPGFEVLDEYESATFFERSCRETLVAAVRRDDPGARFLIRARRLRGSVYREGALDLLQRILTETGRRGRDAAWILAQAEQSVAQLAQSPDQTASCAQELVRLIDELLNYRGNAGVAKLDPLRYLWPSARPSVLKLDGAAAPAAIEILREVCAALPDARGKTGAAVQQIRNLVAASATGFGLEGDLIAGWGERRAVGPTREVAQLLLRAQRDFDEAKRRERAVTFDDLLIAVRDLLRDQPAVANRYRIELRAILVDEYQDTNAVQDEIIALLTEPRPSAAPPAELFIVGDEKQSIYRFRGADVRVFRRARASAPMPLPLAENRRSTPNILNFVNGLGASAMAADDAASAAAYRVVWEAAHALTPARSTIFDYPVEIIPAPTDADTLGGGVAAGKLNAVEKRELEARAIANRIRAIVAAGEPTIAAHGGPQPAAYRDIAVLFRAFADIAIYEQAFIAAAIPCYTVKGRGFYGRREVIDLVELLAAVDDPRDSLALAATLRSPFFALSDNTLLEMGLRLHETAGSGGPASLADLLAGPGVDFGRLATGREEAEQAWRVLDELRRLRGRAPLLEIVERALELTDYESVMAGLPQGAQRVANLRKLIDLARRFDALHFFSFHDFVVYLRRLLEEEPYEPQAQILGESENVIRLMTVHQAKGLEFPIVILADAGRGPNHETRTVLLDPEGGLLLRATTGSGGDEIPNAALDRYRERLADEEAAESVRILYVALTRARDRLIVSEGANTTGWSKLLRKFVGEERFAEFARAGSATLDIEHPAATIVLRRADLSFADGAPASSVAESEEPLPIMRDRLTARVAAQDAMIVSPTALADFERCPRQYWLRHGLGLPEPAQPGSGGGATAMGAVTHQVLERLEFGRNRTNTDRVIIELVESRGGAAGLDSAQRAAIVRDLSRYMATVSDRETIVGRELPFMLDAAPGLFVRGQIDLLLLDGSTIVVRDYKYSRGAEAARYAVQLECYALAAATAMPGHAIAAELVALRDGPQTVAASLPTLQQIRVRLAALAQQLQRARREREYPKKPPHAGACRELGCAYVRRCWPGADPRNGVERAPGRRSLVFD